MFERFTKEARAVVVGAQQQARELGHETIGTEHTLLSLLAGDNGAIRDALSNRGVDQTSVRQAIIEHVGDHSEATTIADRDAEDAAALKAIGIDLDAVRAAIEENFGAGALRLPRPAPKKRGIFGRFQTGTSHIPFSPATRRSSSSPCAKPSASSTTTSRRNTSCSASCAKARAWQPSSSPKKQSTSMRCASS